MNLLTQHSLSTAFILASFPAFAGPFVHAPHSVQEYNQRFIENALAPTMVPGKTFHVSADSGNDANRGTVDKPFKTLEAARDAIREVKKLQGLPPDGIQVSIGPGNYLMQSPLKLVAEDSGTLESPVVWKGVDRDRVIISGGTSLDVTELRPAQESTAQGRFHPKARGKLVVISSVCLENRSSIDRSRWTATCCNSPNGPTGATTTLEKFSTRDQKPAG